MTEGMTGGMKDFATLLETLVLTPSRNAKIAAMAAYFRATPDPDRGIDVGLGLTDPAMVASRVLEYRQELAREWGEAVGSYLPGALQALLAETLEESLQSPEE